MNTLGALINNNDRGCFLYSVLFVSNWMILLIGKKFSRSFYFPVLSKVANEHSLSCCIRWSFRTVLKFLATSISLTVTEQNDAGFLSYKKVKHAKHVLTSSEAGLPC